MKTIVAIGGGDIRSGGTVAIDREIIRRAGKRHPRLLFIPTASGDDPGYFAAIERHFGKRFGCVTDVLYLLKDPPSHATISEKIFSADVIYVGGGNTLMMMRRWRHLGIDRLLKQAYHKGIVLSGISAGAICWFGSGHSDSLSFHHPETWHYINVRGLGLLKGILCPHYNSATRGIPRRHDFQTMIHKIGGVGIAIEDHCAVEFAEQTFRVVTSRPSARAYLLYRRRGRVATQRIPHRRTFTPISALWALCGR